MKAPRIQISWIMAFVAFAALNFGAIRLMSDLQSAMLVEPLVQRNGPYITTIGKLIGYSACTVMLVLPQVVVAGIGGFLTRKFRISGSVAEPPPSQFKAP
jgi:hypothetical protein